MMLAGKPITQDDVHRWPPGTKPTQESKPEPESPEELVEIEPEESSEQDDSNNPLDLNLPELLNPLDINLGEVAGNFGEIAGNLNFGEQCKPGVCRIQLQDVNDSVRDICIHFATGAVGQCDSEDTIHICFPSQLLACHVRADLASTMIDVFLPKPVEPVLVSRQGKSLKFHGLTDTATRMADKIKAGNLDHAFILFRDLVKTKILFVEECERGIQYAGGVSQ